jgi:hypothetical protein
VWEIETQNAVLAAAGAQGGVGLGEVAVVYAAVDGGHAFLHLIAFEIACGGEGCGKKEGED